MVKYDLILVGCGISSLYYLYKLKPEGNILILEKKPFFGGRIQTLEYEAGALRFHSGQKNINHLIKTFNLEKEPLVSNKRLFFNNHLQKIDENLEKKFFQICSQISSNKKYSGFTLATALQDFLSPQEINIFQTWFGYDQKFFEMNAQVLASSLSNYGQNQYFILKNGLSSLTQSLYDEIKNNYDFEFNQKVISFQNNKIQTLQGKTFQAHKIIFTLSPQNLAETNQKFTPLLGMISTQKLNRIYAYFDDDSWFPKFSIFSDLFIKQIWPIKKNLIMISYTTNLDAQQMIRLQTENLLWEYLKKDLEKILNKKITQPKWIKQNYWKIGTHFWKPLSNPKKDIPKLFNMNLMGEAYSQEQGWIESALENVQDFINHNKKEKTFSLTDVKKKNFTVLFGNVYNLKKWIPIHPGGNIIPLGKDITKFFKNVGHTNFALECLQKYYVGKLV